MDRNPTLLHALGQAIGVLAGAICAGLAVLFVVANPYRPVTAEEAGVWIFLIPGIGVLGIAAAGAALVSARRTLIVLFVVSFFPFSFYLMMTPGIWHWFGVAELGYVAAALLLNNRRST